MSLDDQPFRIGMRAISLTEQTDAARAAARAIVGPPRPLSVGMVTTLRTALQRQQRDDLRLCEHLDPGAPAVAWWSPRRPEEVVCTPCHAAEATSTPRRCEACHNRTARAPRQVLHLVSHSEPRALDEHTLTAWPPTIVEAWLCPPCRGRSR